MKRAGPQPKSKFTMNNSKTLTQRALAAHDEAEAARRAAERELMEQEKLRRLKMIELAKTLATEFVQARLGADIDANSIKVKLGDARNYTDVTFTVENLLFLCRVIVPLDEGAHTRLFYLSSVEDRGTQISNLTDLGKLLAQVGKDTEDPTAAPEPESGA